MHCRNVVNLVDITVSLSSSGRNYTTHRRAIIGGEHPIRVAPGTVVVKTRLKPINELQYLWIIINHCKCKASNAKQKPNRRRRAYVTQSWKSSRQMEQMRLRRMMSSLCSGFLGFVAGSSFTLSFTFSLRPGAKDGECSAESRRPAAMLVIDSAADLTAAN